MRFINRWSYSCAKGLSGILNENHVKRAIYYFGFQIIIGAMVKVIILTAVSLALGIFIPTLIISLTFASLRLIAGGYHMDTYGKCLFVSMGLFVTSALIARHTYEYWNFTYLTILTAIAFILGIYVLIRYAPRDTPNKPITDPQEIRRFKVLSIVHIIIWLIITLALNILGLSMYVLSLCFGVLLELFAITPTGHGFFDRIKYGMKLK